MFRREKSTGLVIGSLHGVTGRIVATAPRLLACVLLMTCASTPR